MLEGLDAKDAVLGIDEIEEPERSVKEPAARRICGRSSRDKGMAELDGTRDALPARTHQKSRIRDIFVRIWVYTQ